MGGSVYVAVNIIVGNAINPVVYNRAMSFIDKHMAEQLNHALLAGSSMRIVHMGQT